MKFEYLVLHKESFHSALGQECADAEQAWLNQLGQEGWEFISHKTLLGDTDLYKFKRAIPEK